MRIYDPLHAKDFEYCHPVNHDDFETLNVRLNGTPRGDTWRSPQMKMVRMDRRKKLKVSDSPWLGTPHLIVLSAQKIRCG